MRQMSVHTVIKQFLSDDNIAALKMGIPKEHFKMLLPSFVKFIQGDLARDFGLKNDKQRVTKYNRMFKQIIYDKLMQSDSDTLMTTQDVGKLSRGDYSRDADSILGDWNMNVARQVQHREDRTQTVADLAPDYDDTDYDVIKPAKKSVPLHDIYASGDPENHLDAAAYVFDNDQMKKMNATGYGYSMYYDDPDSALALQEQIWGSADPELGWEGVRSEINHKEVKNHRRHYDRGNDGIRGHEYDGISYRRDMSDLRKRR